MILVDKLFYLEPQVFFNPAARQFFFEMSDKISTQKIGTTTADSIAGALKDDILEKSLGKGAAGILRLLKTADIEALIKAIGPYAAKLGMDKKGLYELKKLLQHIKSGKASGSELLKYLGAIKHASSGLWKIFLFAKDAREIYNSDMSKKEKTNALVKLIPGDKDGILDLALIALDITVGLVPYVGPYLVAAVEGLAKSKQFDDFCQWWGDAQTNFIDKSWLGELIKDKVAEYKP